MSDTQVIQNKNYQENYDYSQYILIRISMEGRLGYDIEKKVLHLRKLLHKHERCILDNYYSLFLEAHGALDEVIHDGVTSHFSLRDKFESWKEAVNDLETYISTYLLIYKDIYNPKIVIRATHIDNRFL